MNIHCACWEDGEPCCWCLDDTEEEPGVDLPECANTRNAECITHIRQELDGASERYYDATEAKDRAVRNSGPS